MTTDGREQAACSACSMPLDGLRLCAADESDCPVGLPTYPPPAKEIIESAVRSLGAYPSACATTVLSLLREKGYEITLAATARTLTPQVLGPPNTVRCKQCRTLYLGLPTCPNCGSDQHAPAKTLTPPCPAGRNNDGQHIILAVTRQGTVHYECVRCSLTFMAAIEQTPKATS